MVKVTSTVLRGGGSSNAASLPDRKVVIEGRLRFHAWETEGGAKRSKVDVVADRVNFLPRANKNGNGGANDGSEFDGDIPLPEDSDIPF